MENFAQAKFGFFLVIFGVERLKNILWRNLSKANFRFLGGQGFLHKKAWSAVGGTRTCDHVVNSHALYLLSYDSKYVERMCHPIILYEVFCVGLVPVGGVEWFIWAIALLS